MENFKPDLFAVDEHNFAEHALRIFRFQVEHNDVYRDFVHALRVDPFSVATINEIPFLPISFFKQHDIRSGKWVEETTFLSSSTTGRGQSRHQVRDLTFYHEHALHCFEHFFGAVSQYHILALLPSYLEREGSSLISMIDFFIRRSGSNESGFFLHDHERLLATIQKLGHAKRRIILWGVSFALLDLAEQKSADLSHCIIFETGGMKGRRKEITRQELHEILQRRLNVSAIYSEYGMTELMSQAYTTGGTLFRTPPSMRVLGRDISDPLTRGVLGENAALNVVDLANWHTVSFIETEDQGKVYEDGSFEVLGRLDNSEVRGCNLLI